MQRDTKKNYQLYGRNDMIMLDEHNKIYGSLGLAEPYIVATKEGETLLLDGAKDNEPFIGLSLYGKSHQNTVAGNQLFDAPEGSKTIKGVNYSKGENGGISVNGTAEMGGGRTDPYFTENKILLKAGTYTLCGYCDNGAGLEFGLENLSLEVISGFAVANTPKQYTFSEDTEVIVFVQVVVNGTVNQEVFIMLNAGSTALPWEPYTGGQPSPNPDYPQEIVSVGDDGEIEVTVANDGYVEKGTTYSGVKKIPLKKGSWIYLQKPVTHVNDMNAFIVDDPDLISKMIDDNSAYLYSYCYWTLGLTSPAESGNVIRENSRLVQNWRNGVKYKIDADGLYLYYAVNKTSYDTEDCYVWFWDEELSTEREYKSQPLIVSTPNGLPGIPVSSGGNYTDGNGQQWISDEVDYRRGKCVRRVELLRITDFSKISNPTYTDLGNTECSIRILGHYPDVQNMSHVSRSMCDSFIYSSLGDYERFAFDSSTKPRLYFTLNGVLSREAFITKMEEISPTILFPLATPIETDLTPEQIAAYQSLHTNYPATTVMNDEGAGMKAIYKQIENGG